MKCFFYHNYKTTNEKISFSKGSHKITITQECTDCHKPRSKEKDFSYNSNCCFLKFREVKVSNSAKYSLSEDARTQLK